MGTQTPKTVVFRQAPLPALFALLRTIEFQNFSEFLGVKIIDMLFFSDIMEQGFRIKKARIS